MKMVLLLFCVGTSSPTKCYAESLGGQLGLGALITQYGARRSRQCWALQAQGVSELH